MKLFIKYMVSIRCKMMVKAELDRMDLHYSAIDLGEVEIKESLTPLQTTLLEAALKKMGLELMHDKKAVMIERIKAVIIEMIHYADELPGVKNSEYISKKLHRNYTYLAGLFSETTGITIEHFIIAHKIEKVKELLLYDEMNLTEISYRLNYSSVAHLSNQFKKITGLTPSFYKKMRVLRRKPLEDI